MSSPELSKLLDGRRQQQQIEERAGRILTCRVSKFPCSVLLALSTNEIHAQISWVGQSTIAECPWAFKIARWKKTTTTDRGESRPHCRAARAGKLQSSECGPVEHVVVSKHLMCIARIFFSSSGRESRSSGKAAVELVDLSACEQLQFDSNVKLALHLIQTFMSKGSMSLNRKIQQWLPFYNRYIITHHISAWNVITYHIW